MEEEIHLGMNIMKISSKVMLSYHLYSSAYEVDVYTKIWKESHRDPEAPRIVSSRDQLRADLKQLIQMRNLGIGFLQTAPADNDRGYARRQDENMLDSTKRERLESKLS